MNFYSLIEDFRINPYSFFYFIKRNKFDLFQIKIYKEKWKKKISSLNNFFSFTDFLFNFDDFIVIKSLDKNHSSFIFKNYLLDYQKFCIDFFGDKKNIVIVNNNFEELNKTPLSPFFTSEIFVLFKDEDLIKKQLKSIR